MVGRRRVRIETEAGFKIYIVSIAKDKETIQHYNRFEAAKHFTLQTVVPPF